MEYNHNHKNLSLKVKNRMVNDMLDDQLLVLKQLVVGVYLQLNKCFKRVTDLYGNF